MKSRFAFAVAVLALLPGPIRAQTTPVEGLRENAPRVHALTNARIVLSPERELAMGTLVIRDGVIEAVGPDVAPPADARVWDMAGRTLYPGFIDAYSDVGMRDELPEGSDEGERGATYWSPQVRSHIDAGGELSVESDAGPAALRGQGFTLAMAVPRIGMFRGQTAAVALGEGTAAERVVRPGIAQAVTLRADRELPRGYPTSSMGAFAFIRQTLHDADWHRRAREAYARSPRGVSRPESNAALRALEPAARGQQPLLFEAGSEEESLRLLGLRDEFPIDVWLRGTGSEYRLLEAFRGLDGALILPVDFPSAPDVAEGEEALNHSLERLRHWYLAPENPGRLEAAGLRFALTSDGLEDRSRFLPNVRRAVERGLSPGMALAALTTTPAEYLGLRGTHGTLEVGKAANVVVATGDLFSGEAEVAAVWIDGERFEITAALGADPRGEWRIEPVGEDRVEGTLVLRGTRGRLTGTFIAAGSEIPLGSARVAGETPRVHVTFPGHVLGHEGPVRLSGSVTAGAMQGWGELPDGRRFNWTGERIGDAPVEGDRRTDGPVRADTGGADTTAMATGLAGSPLELRDVRPAMEYGRESPPAQPRELLVRGATVWTMGPAGVLENADLLVREGRVVRVGQGLEAPRGAVIIDAAGKHVSPGLIDPHIHSGVTSVNEVGSAIVPEVRIGDVLTIHNIWMYRQLAGGLTSAHVMHGSANPIGGQNQHVKLRWGALPEGLKIQGAPRTVKFALGENPKRRSERYPDTRMGTEQIIRDHFRAAREYERSWQEWERGRQRGIPPRRDLRMEALVDILNGDIRVQSHSYRQDEILMLMRLAEEFGFRIAAFHHGVEAYKVAPELAAHGAAAVVWSDWGAFKVEAYDNTTYNARILTDAGVLTTLHSDNSQIASRMNWEAAKMLRTGMSPEEALALVTINAARVLGVDDRIGSLEPGKDADFVIWSHSPLSTTTRVEQTWIDGRRYFDLEEDRRLRARAERERSRLIELILNER